MNCSARRGREPARHRAPRLAGRRRYRNQLVAAIAIVRRAAAVGERRPPLPLGGQPRHRIGVVGSGAVIGASTHPQRRCWPAAVAPPPATGQPRPARSTRAAAHNTPAPTRARPATPGGVACALSSGCSPTRRRSTPRAGSERDRQPANRRQDYCGHCHLAVPVGRDRRNQSELARRRAPRPDPPVASAPVHRRAARHVARVAGRRVKKPFLRPSIRFPRVRRVLLRHCCRRQPEQATTTVPPATTTSTTLAPTTTAPPPSSSVAKSFTTRPAAPVSGDVRVGVPDPRRDRDIDHGGTAHLQRRPLAAANHTQTRLAGIGGRPHLW